MNSTDTKTEDKYIAHFKTSLQINESQWEVYNKFKEINDQTTVGEIKEWYKSIHPNSPVDIHITQL